MKGIIIEVSDSRTAEKTDIVFSRQDIAFIRQQAGDYPVSPLLVKKIEEAARKEGFLLITGQSDLFRIAKQIIIEDKEYFSISGQRVEDAISIVKHHPAKRDKAAPRLQRLLCRHYKNPIHDLEKLKAEIDQEELIPVLWTNTGGFEVSHLSRQFPLFDRLNPVSLKDPRQAIRFVINQPQNRMGYVFEDIHHFIGAKDSISPAFGEIRSLVKELYRSLTDRNERVYFFVPDSYELPPDIKVFLEDADRPEGKGEVATLGRFGRQMTAPDYIRKIKPVIGANLLIERIIQTLSQMEGNNPLLVGHPGVGKTAAVEGFALALVEGRVPENLLGKTLYSISLASLIAGTKYRGEMEARLEKLMDEVLQHQDETILFIDEIQGLLDAGVAEGGFGIGDILKPVLSRGEFPLIGATTFAGAEHLARDSALMRRFRTIIVDEPSSEETLKILRGIRARFEQHHSVRIEESALLAAVRLGSRQNQQAYQPGKAIALLDGAAAYCRIKGMTTVCEIDILREVNRK